MNSFFKNMKGQRANILLLCHLFSRLALVWLFSMFFLSILEIVINSINRQYPSQIFQVIIFAFANDLIFWISDLFGLFFIFLVVSYFSQKLAIIISQTFLMVFFAIQLALMDYFNTALVPLGSDLFSYSLTDILQIIGSTSGLNIIILFLFFGLLALLFVVTRYLLNKLQLRPFMAIGFPLASIFLYFTPLYSIAFNMPTEYENNLIKNKTAFFLSSSAEYFFNSNEEIDIYSDAYIGDFDGIASTVAKMEYPFENQYPFYHSNVAPDVLSPFFQPLKKQPNIVILLVEGLGRAFTNDGAYLGNFTPFVDSLAGKSLYWKNILSAGGRTFAVLPALMGSMPFGKNGILEMGNDIPKHLSLYTILKRNGYQTSFYYGGKTEFDGMKSYLDNNHVDQIIEEKSFPAGYTKLPATAQNFTWGYSDDQLYQLYFENRSKSTLKKPELNVILTVATHDPFLIRNQDKYIQMAKSRMKQIGLDENKQAEYNNFLNQFSSIMYADESIKKFIQTYSKRADFANTIFIITGDHRLPEIPMSTKIDRYHVPLLIYSPMLKRTAQFASVSTHFDIAPSLLATLEKQINIKLPKAGNSWIGDGLDTVKTFRNIHHYPLMQNKSTLVDFVMNDYHINGNSLFKITENMEESPINDDIKLNQLKQAFNQFKKKNSQVIRGVKIVPDSLISRYGIN